MNDDKKQGPVFVTRASLPSKSEYLDCVEDIFASRWLTNNGKYAVRLTAELKKMLGARCLHLCANGTLALQLAIRLLGLNGKKVVTTPFTYVSTVSSLLWEQCQPIFADIDSETLCIAPSEVEKALNKHPDAMGVLPVHVYGNACAVEELDSIAGRYGVRVLYDAAHAFGCELQSKSLLTFGDASICSFHSTKLFHTVEGGCVVTNNEKDAETLNLLGAFGHYGDEHKMLGINAKLSELHAAMGVCLLPKTRSLIEMRSKKTSLYDQAFQNCGQIRMPVFAKGLKWNHSYYPVIFDSAKSRIMAAKALKSRDIHPRRYFYPSLTKLPYIAGQSCPIAEDISERVLCLPLWPDMEDSLVAEIAEIILKAI